MWKQKQFDGSELGLSNSFSLLTLETIPLPRFEKNMIFLRSGHFRASFAPTGKTGGGAHGHLEEFIRTDISGHPIRILLKTSKIPDLCLRTEAFVQWIAQKTLETQNLGTRIPAVHDIVEIKNGTFGFTMTEISGAVLCSQFLATTLSLNHDLLHILGQTAILLQQLEETIGLDHRDLKADNLLITPTPSTLLGPRGPLQSPFTVSLVDFGFACLGDDGITAVDAGQGTLPLRDPCPKEGRDLFHLIVSLYGIPAIRASLNPRLRTLFTEWLTVQGKPCMSMAEKWSHSEWVYLLTSQKKFTQPSCTPAAILDTIFTEIASEYHSEYKYR